MAFTSEQLKALKAKLSYQHVKKRFSHGATLHYLEGWHVISEANRIFGFENWDRRTTQPKCLWSKLHQGHVICFYSTRVRVLVRAGEVTIVREGIGTGIGKAPEAEIAHELALKAAETDATKRALATFGNPFGLALYDKEQTAVSKPKRTALKQDCEGSPSAGSAVELVMQDAEGKRRTFVGPEELFTAVEGALKALQTVPDVYRFWEANRGNFVELGRHLETRDLAERIVAASKARARVVGTQGTQQTSIQEPPHSDSAVPEVQIHTARRGTQGAEAPQQIKSSSSSGFLIPKERRRRDKAHLAYVRTKACLICGRKPSHAHHLKFAQPQAMAMKVSDEFTVPLCSIHHGEVHRTGDERAWWARHGIIEPLKIAERLWRHSQGQEAGKQDGVPERSGSQLLL